ncbi:HlyD family efflux transporter periplasmic adaptor subunit [Clostridium cylindrosporum]|uniref:HlyD family secretion protein n=1 Tax=Clostridium cylindrosporum DSM 605 TaxID=1121307 RepID=A0A0J8DAU0_CLOCY|nr:HlyD family efflux transporter periplasmic adaptor subunit [Clostridium cylindrosporum]KMT21429.1 HlyD family secretion protein [Clostridium cylindrosporum DSM 605]
MLKKIGIRNTLIYLACLLIVYFTFIFRIPVDTTRAEYTIYEDKVYFKGIYFADENVIYKNPIETLGKLNAENGTKIGKGDKISDNLISNDVGILMYNIDGYENKFNLNNIKSLSLLDMDKIIDNHVISPGLKVIYNESLYIYSFIGKDGSFKKGQNFYISIGSSRYMCKILDTVSRKEGNFLVLKLVEDINYKNLHRGITGDIIKSSHKGILIPSSAIKLKGDTYKVFVKKVNGYADIKNVNVVYDDGENAVVIPKGQNTIQQYDEIIIDPPKILKDGTKVR